MAIGFTSKARAQYGFCRRILVSWLFALYVDYTDVHILASSLVPSNWKPKILVAKCCVSGCFFKYL